MLNNNKFIVIELKDDERILYPIKTIISNDIPLSYINKKENNDLKYYKNQLDEIPNNKDWDMNKKLTNNYELIHMPNYKRKENNSISLYNPLSRSYYKMIEILKDFNILNHYKNTNIVTGHLAEGPGGFIEAIVNKRRNKNDNYHAITLKSIRKEIPGWRKAKYLLDRNQNIHIHYGKDDTGNLYNLDNILDFKDKIKNKCDIVTADGGFDFSINFNLQEQLSSHLIFCEIITALTIQKIGGLFICKIFDSYCKITIDILWLLSCVYDKVIITKPNTSRPANSEKYIVAIGYRGINSIYLNQLYDIINKWNQIEKNNKYLHSIFDNIEYNLNFMNIIQSFNIYNSMNQIKNIKNTLNILKGNIHIDKNKIKDKQIKTALIWCKNYNIDINFNSIYLNNKNKYMDYFDIDKYNKWNKSIKTK